MAEKNLLLRISANVGDATKGLGAVRDGVTAILASAAAGGEKIGHGTADAMEGLALRMSAVRIVASEILDYAETAVELTQFAAEYERLHGSVSDRALSGMRSATAGLVDDMTLLRAGTKAMQGDWAITEDELISVARAAEALHERGLGPTAEIFQRLTDALRRGTIESLKEYGLNIDTAKGKTEQLNDAVLKLTEIGQGAGGGGAGSATQRFLVEMKNGWGDVKYAAGATIETVVGGMEQTELFLERNLESLVVTGDAWRSLYTELAGQGAYGWNVQARAMELTEDAARRNRIELEHLQRTGRQYGTMAEELAQAGLPALRSAFDAVRGSVAALAEDLTSTDFTAWDAKLAEIRAEVAEDERLERERNRQRAAAEWKAFLAEVQRDADARAEMENRAHEQADAGYYAGLHARFDALKVHGDAVFEYYQQQNERLLDVTVERTGADAEKKKEKKKEEPRDPYRHLKTSAAAYADQVEQLRGGLMDLGNAGAQAFAMLISGQEGAGTAFEDSVILMLRAEAARSAALALQSLGLAAWNAAMQNYVGAAAALKAAAIFGAFAIAYGAGAAVGGSTSGERDAAEKAAKERSDTGRGSRDAGPGLFGGGGGGGSTVVENHYYFGYNVGTERDVANAIEKVQRRGGTMGARRGRPGARRPSQSG